MYPKLRNPWLTWLLSLGTLGVYCFYWVNAVCKELNFAEREKIFPIDFWTYFLIWWTVGLILASIVLAVTGVFLPYFVLFLAWAWLVSHVSLCLASYVVKKQRKFGLGIELNPYQTAFLCFATFSGLVKLQDGINQVILWERQLERL